MVSTRPASDYNKSSKPSPPLTHINKIKEVVLKNYSPMSSEPNMCMDLSSQYNV